MLEAFVLRCTVQSRQRPNSCGRLSCIGGRRRRSNNILRAILPKRIDQTVFCRFEPSPLPARATPLAWADSGLIHVCTGRFSPGQSRLYSQLRASYLQQQHDMQPCNFLKAIGRCTMSAAPNLRTEALLSGLAISRRDLPECSLSRICSEPASSEEACTKVLIVCKRPAGFSLDCPSVCLDALLAGRRDAQLSVAQGDRVVVRSPRPATDRLRGQSHQCSWCQASHHISICYPGYALRCTFAALA